MHILTSVGLSLAMLASPQAATAKPDATQNALTSKERAEGWQLLFNGRDLTGWQSFDGSAPAPTWKVRDGVLMLTKDDGQMSGTDLVTTQNYATFELTLDWKAEKGGNSGVLYLARHTPEAKQLYQSGLEMQILDNDGHSDGKIPSHRAGSLYDITVPPAGATRPAGQWNHARLLVQPGRIRQWLNGTPTADVSFRDAEWRKRVAASKFADMKSFGIHSSGVIGLQDHGEPTAFRNIKVRRLK